MKEKHYFDIVCSAHLDVCCRNLKKNNHQFDIYVKCRGLIFKYYNMIDLGAYYCNSWR